MQLLVPENRFQRFAVKMVDLAESADKPLRVVEVSGVDRPTLKVNGETLVGMRPSHQKLKQLVG